MNTLLRALLAVAILASLVAWGVYHHANDVAPWRQAA